MYSETPTTAGHPSGSDHLAQGNAVTQAAAAIARGEFVVVMDATDRENEADLILSAAAASTEKLAFLIAHTSGIVCVPMTGERADTLGLPPMVSNPTDPHRTAFTVSVDARAGTTTGISAADRAATARALAEPTSAPDDFVRPGHMFPLRAHPEGIHGRGGHTEAAVELARLAGVPEVMLICELTCSDGSTAGHREAWALARHRGLAIVETSQLRTAVAAPNLVAASRVTQRTPTIALPTDWGDFTATLMTTEPDGLEHLVLTLGDPSGSEPVLVRIHSECATGDLFGSRRCDCGQQLHDALDAIRGAGRGVLLYERGHEGRGIGLGDKLRAYRLQEEGADTVDANLRLGHPADARDFAPAATVLRELGLTAVSLMTNNPDKLHALRAAGLRTEGVPLRTVPLADNIHYLQTKRARFDHDLAIGATAAQLRPAVRRR